MTLACVILSTLYFGDMECRKVEGGWCCAGEKVDIKLVHSLPLSKLQVCFTIMTASHRLKNTTSIAICSSAAVLFYKYSLNIRIR